METLSLQRRLRFFAVALVVFTLSVSTHPHGARADATSTGRETTAQTNPNRVVPEAPTACSISFSDVLTSDYFYEGVFNLFCRGAIGGYPDNTFRPGNNTTRGQLTKIEVLAKGWPLVDPAVASFSDVPRGSTFYQYVETARAHGILGGYPDGTFRPDTEVIRGQ